MREREELWRRDCVTLVFTSGASIWSSNDLCKLDSAAIRICALTGQKIMITYAANQPLKNDKRWTSKVQYVKMTAGKKESPLAGGVSRLVGSFSNDDGNGKENVTWKSTLAQLWVFCDYPILVFTKSVDSNFRAFWLAPVTWNSHEYSLFCERREKWRDVSRKFQKKKLKKRYFIHLIW